MNHTVAIIGAGFSGTVTALNILGQPNLSPEVRIALIDPRGTFGPGLAYSVPSDRFKLNVRAKAMGAFPEDPDGFLRWLKEREPSVSGEDFISRRWYGQYLTDLVTEIGRKRPQQLQLIAAEALSVTHAGGIFEIALSDSQTIRAETCVLAVGNILRRSLETSQSASLQALREPYSQQSYSGISAARKIFILGSSLTAVDVIVECEGQGFTGSYSVVSRHGRFPRPHEDPVGLPLACLPEGWEAPGTALELLKMIRKASRACGSSQPVFDAMRPHIPEMWRNLSADQKRAFLRHARPFWEIHRHRIPAEHLAVLERLRASGRLRIAAGRVAEIAPGLASISPRGGMLPRESIPFDIGFMCVGPEGDISRIEHPLIHSLISQKLIHPGPLRLGIDSSEGCSVPRFFVIGPFLREETWEITAVRELRVEAQRVARLAVGASL